MSLRFAFTDEQRQLQGAVRDLLARECSPLEVRAAWGDDAVRRALWSSLAQLGVTGLTVAEAEGGLGLREIDLVLPVEECGRAAFPGPLVETVAVGAPLLAELAGSEARRRWLPRVVDGEAVLTVGLRATGSFALPCAEGEGEGRGAFGRLPMSGLLVAEAEAADALLLEAEGGELHLVERAAVRLDPCASVDGARRLCRVTWSPSSATCLASGRAAAQAIARAFDRGALATAAQLCGLAQHLLDVTVEYVQVRQQFGKAIGAFQAVKHRLADVLVALEFARPLVYRAAWSLARGERDGAVHVSAAKAAAGDAATGAARAALQCHGAIGYSFEHDLHLWMKRAWALAAAWGDADWHRERIAQHLLDGE